MADPPTRQLVRRKPYRKKKAYENVSDLSVFFSRTFNPDGTAETGLWCGECRRRQRWKDLDVSYQYRTGDIFRTWFCPGCGNQLRDDNLSDLALANEADEREKVMDLSGQVARMDALERGTEELLGMSMSDYAKLCDEHPKRAKKALKAAIVKAEEHQAKWLKKLAKKNNKSRSK